MNSLVEIENLSVHFDVDGGTVQVLDQVSFGVDAGRFWASSATLAPVNR